MAPSSSGHTGAIHASALTSGAFGAVVRLNATKSRKRDTLVTIQVVVSCGAGRFKYSTVTGEKSNWPIDRNTTVQGKSKFVFALIEEESHGGIRPYDVLGSITPLEFCNLRKPSLIA
jgi:hypothetical protein